MKLNKFKQGSLIKEIEFRYIYINKFMGNLCLRKKPKSQ